MTDPLPNPFLTYPPKPKVVAPSRPAKPATKKVKRSRRPPRKRRQSR